MRRGLGPWEINQEESGQKIGWAKKWKKGKSELEIGEGAVAESAIDRIAAVGTVTPLRSRSSSMLRLDQTLDRQNHCGVLLVARHHASTETGSNGVDLVS